MSPSSSTQGGPGGLAGVDAGFAEGGEGFNSLSKMGARLCSAPVLCAQDMSGMDDGEQDEADEMTHRAFKHYVNTLAQVPITTSICSTIKTRDTKKTISLYDTGCENDLFPYGGSMGR